MSPETGDSPNIPPIEGDDTMNPEIKKALVILLLYKNELKELAKKSTTTIDDTVVDMLVTGATMFVGSDLAGALDKEFPESVPIT